MDTREIQGGLRGGVVAEGRDVLTTLGVGVEATCSALQTLPVREIKQ